MMLLLSILVIPLFASILINICPTGNQTIRIPFPNVSTSLEISSKDIVKYLPIFSSLITLLIIIIYAGQNNLITKNTHEELVKLYDLFPSLNVSMSFSVTKISIALLVLSNITIITALFSTLNIEKRLNQINTLISIISVGIFGLILADDLFVFFLFYEIAVVPMFLIITNWGYSLEREVSGPFSKILNTLSVGTKNYGAYKITLYLLIGSMLIFLGLGSIGVTEGTFSISELLMSEREISYNLYAYFLLLIGFGAHSALWPFHTWVPDGHGTAPTAGSIIFAGILMKIGIIGFIKILIPLMSNIFIEYSSLLIVLASINIIYGAFTAMMQDDLKYLAAYASLSHIGYIFLALAMHNQIGINGAIVQTISHGLIISLLFFSIGIIHATKGTRSIKELNSMMDNSPLLSHIFIFVAFASIGFPLTSGFIAEFLIMSSVWIYNHFLLVVPLLGILITTLYMFRTVKKICLQFRDNNKDKTDLKMNERIICYALVILILLIGIFPNFVITFLSGESINILGI